MTATAPGVEDLSQSGTAARHAFTPSRIVALAVIGAAVIGLGYLRFAPGPAPATVPPGARAGDLTLQACTYPTESGADAAECGTLIVAENDANPTSQLIALPVTRVKATSANPGEPIFYLEGGPGISNMVFPRASRFTDSHDVILVGYRGADGSVRLDCPEVESALRRAIDPLNEDSFRANADAFRACARRLQTDGVDLANYGLVQQVDDLEAARQALGYRRINLLSGSAGTRTAMIYAWRYPESIHRSVMIGVDPPGHFLIYDPEATDEQIARIADLCSKDARCSARTADLSATMRQKAADVPERWLFLPIKAGNVRSLSFFGLMQATATTFPPGAAVTLDAWLSAAEGDASGFWLTSVLGDLMYPKLFVWGQWAAARADAQAARDYFSSGGQDRHPNLGYDTTAMAWSGGQLVDAWPRTRDEGEYSRVRTTPVETLLVGGERDLSTPPQFATQELLPFLPNGQEVVLAGFGHTPSFWVDQPAAGTRLIIAFLDSGRIDDSLYVPQMIDFAPPTTLTGMGKLLAGAMIGLGLLTVLSLLWMARRVRQRRSFGRNASAALRALYPIVLGLGGWFLGALLGMTAMLPGVGLDDQLLIVVSVGVSIGLAVYFAWVHHDWSARTRNAGLASAVGGALVGAWLGYNAAGGLIAPVTAIVGAVVGANLAVLTLDIRRDRQARDRFVDTSVNATLEPLTLSRP